MAHALLRRMIPAVLLAATATVGGSIVADSAIAYAAPKELDVGQYEDCTDQVQKDFVNGLIESEELDGEFAKCCANAGGTWNNSTKDCDAPPENPAQQAPGWVPPGGMPGTAPTHTFQPAQPVPRPPAQQPGNVTQTFEPAPVG